ncbi:MAG: hypothetical protein ACYTGL_14775 [Planctomycetota bacterium]|jgi:hypothetical protein
MSCCDNCDCIATLRVRQLGNADYTFDAMVDQQSHVDEYRESWYSGVDNSFRGSACRWQTIVETAGGTRFELRAWHGGSQPLMTLAPLDDDDRPLCLHVFSSFDDPHGDHPPAADHEWTIEVTNAGDDQLDIAFTGQHLGYPIPCDSPGLNGTEDGSGRLARFDLLQYATPGQPQTYRMTKGRDENGTVLSFKLAPWGNEASPRTYAADDTPEEIEDDLHENAVLPPIAYECLRGGLDLFGYSRTLGDASLGPQLDWTAVTLWLTFHEVQSPPTRVPVLRDGAVPYVTNLQSLESDETSMFHDHGRMYLWPPNDLDWWFKEFADEWPFAQPPWPIGVGLSGGAIDSPRGQDVVSIWLDRQDEPLQHDNRLLFLYGSVQITRSCVRLVLRIDPAQIDTQKHGYVWIEYRSTHPPDLINDQDYTLVFAGVFAAAAAPDGGTPEFLPLDWQQANHVWASSLYGLAINRLTDLHGVPIDFAALTWRVLVTDFGATRRAGLKTPATFSTGYTVIADGWSGGDTATGMVEDLNGEHVLWGDTDSGFAVDNPDWQALTFGNLSLGYSLVNEHREVPNSFHSPVTAPYRISDWWHPSRQYLVAHIDNKHYYYAPKTRAVVSDDPDTLVFVRTFSPPALIWRHGNPSTPVVTGVPDEITVRVGPAKVSSHCPVCVENQQVTPMAWEATFGDEEFLLLRRSDCVWAAHVAGLQPHWLPEGHDLLPDPLHHRLFVLEGLETLRLYEVPANGGQRRPLAVYRFRPIEHPGPPLRADNPATPNVDESFAGWQASHLDCESPRRLTLWMFGQGYDPAVHLLPSHIDLTPVGNQCIGESVAAEWHQGVNRWEPLDAELLPDDFGLPAVPGTYPDRDERTLCVDFDGADAGVIWIEGEGWRVFAVGCASGDLPAVPGFDGEPDEVRRVNCYTPDPPDPPASTCRWISNDGTTWDPLETTCPEGHECREPSRDPDFVGDVADGYCEPVSCLDGESTWVWIGVAQDWYLWSSTCPAWCEPVKPTHVGSPGDAVLSTCSCETCS